MRLSERKISFRISYCPVGSSTVMLLVSFVFAAPVLAHSLLVSRGEVVVHTDHVEVHLEMALEDLFHWYDPRPDADGKISRAVVMETAAEHTFVLERLLVVRDHAGNRLQGECRLAQTYWPAEGSVDFTALRLVEYTWKFPLSGETPLLLFQLGRDALSVEIPWQVVLSGHGVLQTTGTMMRLTNRGNVEVLELSWDNVAPEAKTSQAVLDGGLCTRCDDRGVSRFKEICAEIDIHDEAVNVSLWVPLSLLTTWTNVLADGESFLGPQEQALVTANARELMKRAMDVETGGEIAEAQVVDIQMVSIGGGATDAKESVERISLWTGLLRARLRFEIPGHLDSAKLRWNLFNGGVLSARAFIRGHGDCIENEFSTYRPIFDWRRKFHHGE